MATTHGSGVNRAFNIRATKKISIFLRSLNNSQKQTNKCYTLVPELNDVKDIVGFNRL